jgi:hypothetical protein
MKRVKKLSYNERKIVASWGLNPENWGKERIVDGRMTLVNTVTNKTREIPARMRLK